MATQPLNILALAFLASRAPAAYRSRAIAQRISSSGLLDADVGTDEVEAALRGMASRDKWVMVEIDPVTKAAGWYATDIGVQQWVIAGRLIVD